MYEIIDSLETELKADLTKLSQLLSESGVFETTRNYHLGKEIAINEILNWLQKKREKLVQSGYAPIDSLKIKEWIEIKIGQTKALAEAVPDRACDGGINAFQMTLEWIDKNANKNI